MTSIPRVAGVLFYSFSLGLGLPNVTLAIENTLATDEIPAQQNSERKGSLPGLFEQGTDARRGIHTIKGKVLRSEANQYVVKRSDGKQVRLHVDETTQVTRTFAPGEWIEAKVVQYNDGDYALSINPAP